MSKQIATNGRPSDMKKRGYKVTEVYEAIGTFYVQATSKAEALRKVNDHLVSMGGNEDVTPEAGTEGELIKREARRATPEEDRWFES